MEHIENSEASESILQEHDLSAQTAEVLRLLAKKLNPPLVTLLSSESEARREVWLRDQVCLRRRTPSAHYIKLQFRSDVMGFELKVALAAFFVSFDMLRGLQVSAEP